MPRGFMLFELMVVVTVLFFCATVGFVTYTSLKGSSFSHDAALIRLLVRTAATRASCLKKDQEIKIDQQDSVLLYDGTRYPLSPGLVVGVLPGTYGPPSAPHKLVVDPITFVDKHILAYTDGTVQAGTLYIHDSDRQYAITTPVASFSHIRVYRYDTNNLWQKYL